jgi:hypothetical protein
VTGTEYRIAHFRCNNNKTAGKDTGLVLQKKDGFVDIFM